MNQQSIAQSLFSVTVASRQYDPAIEHKINQKTKPLGALGQLESLALQIARVQYSRESEWINAQPDRTESTVTESKAATCSPLYINKPTMLVFAADHGIAAHGVSIAPSEVTTQMVHNFIHGGAAINVFCRQVGFALEVIDCGILQPLASDCGVVNQRLGAGTQAMHLQPAMSLAQVRQGFEFAKHLVKRHVDNGCSMIALGEMGIGNTSAAAAVMAAVLNLDVELCVGRGTGIDDATLNKKVTLINQAIDLHRNELTSIESILAHLGGFEIVQMTGAILAAAEQKILVVIDGFIATAAALVALKLAPQSNDYLVFAHQSHEQGHQLMLQTLQATPLLSLGLRLGEGTGAALALPLIQGAVNFYNQMASFDDAGVNNVV
ncbi:nicotinate-nucleotide--dimethylbenzimidazole phosphoribosyltransferase [Shewanella saliphila]|uniref:Nicotinate-nucleotide--dimethylbenzimidazole phosphoribosyltransferase n=1 Tax=Shewanella saliphila TaxID=2282698 RepID=A0ABQ2QAV1_9GAMM|nr:nicotinate-nucleotide--dimethylbenzimidazole phosphoribosyltransferase [Shewanella saliphila]MCL1103532.1 nicotinate-nucleotide--dimethylbenzimidazole phosphoribosyltransferase [Shewanella saliphila]GGP70267.1 nicotinate-nucleotide--dimethylbenzimidazole phosphoribosyltransferase [Shewanella saliphila]